RPFERLFLPLDWNAEPYKPQSPSARTVGGCWRGRWQRTGHVLDVWHSNIAIEAVRVGHQRPERLRGRPQLPLPAIVKGAHSAHCNADEPAGAGAPADSHLSATWSA